MGTDLADNSSFLTYLVAALSVYELGTSVVPLPRYDGPSDTQTDTILRSLAAMARRMYVAEDALASIWHTNGPDTKKRRSVGDITALFCSPLPDITQSYSPQPNGDSYPFTSNYKQIPDDHLMNCDNEMHIPEETPSPKTSSRIEPMSISLDNIPNNFSSSKAASAPPSSHSDHTMCPTCGRAITDDMTLGRVYNGLSNGSPLIIPPGPLATAAFESGMSAVEELRLLKAQVQDVARVCNAVARGDLSQKITVPVQGVVMVQLKDVINTMVRYHSLASD
jgi:osomolarity two-component system sensor histidine kinase NIK1